MSSPLRRTSSSREIGLRISLGEVDEMRVERSQAILHRGEVAVECLKILMRKRRSTVKKEHFYCWIIADSFGPDFERAGVGLYRYHFDAAT